MINVSKIQNRITASSQIMAVLSLKEEWLAVAALRFDTDTHQPGQGAGALRVGGIGCTRQAAPPGACPPLQVRMGGCGAPLVPGRRLAPCPTTRGARRRPREEVTAPLAGDSQGLLQLLRSCGGAGAGLQVPAPHREARPNQNPNGSFHWLLLLFAFAREMAHSGRKRSDFL